MLFTRTSGSARRGIHQPSGRRSIRSRIASLLGASGQNVEQLEPRAMLTAEALPQGAAWIDWNGGVVAAMRGSYIVTFEDYLGKDNAELLARDVAARLGVSAGDFRAIGRGAWATFQTGAEITAEQAASVAATLPGVKWIEPNLVRKSTRVPVDPSYDQQWQLNNTGQNILGVNGVPGADVDTERAWDITTGSRDVVIAVIDTGVQLDHPDLRANIWVNPGEIPGDFLDNDGNGFVDDVNGYDFGEGDSDPSDSPDVGGHGTPVAGIIGAVSNNGIGVAGVSWNVSIMALKIANSFGGLSNDSIIAAHDYATTARQRGVNLVATNNSYGAFAPQFYQDLPTGFNAERDAIARFTATGGLFVASAGNNQADNDNPNAANFPATYNLPGVISVAASDNTDGLAGFSAFGQQSVDLAAPGNGCLTVSVGSGYAFFGGTSCAAPMVTGAIALMKAAKPSASATEIEAALVNSVDLLPGLQGRVRSGGRLNVARALQVLLNDGPVVQTVSPGPITTTLDQSTGQPVRTIEVQFSEPIDDNVAFFNTTAVRFRADGNDNLFGTVDDVNIGIASIARSQADPKRAIIQLGVAQLGAENYELTLFNAGFRDPSGNRLVGTLNGTPGPSDFLTQIRVVNAAGENEQNDTLAVATPVSFSAGGQATISAVTLGNGTNLGLDVDIYRLDLARGGQITAEVVAKRLSGGSTLDSVLRLFDANGVEIARNDQFFGADSFIDFFVNNGGTYYLGVSGFGNAAYDPAVASSGSAQSTGLYTLKIATAQAADDTIRYTAGGNSIAGQPAFPINIPRGGEPSAPTETQGVTTVAITVPDVRTILDVNVSLNAQHTAVGDLRISLIGPSGLEVLLLNRRGGVGDDLGTRNAQNQPIQYTTFDDEGSAPASGANAPFLGVLRPEGSLAAFDGLTANGTWTLRIADERPTDSGRIYDWNITFTFSSNIFGPFEANDSISTASALAEIVNVGASTRQASIGDGGFGNRDRDFFRFTAESGSTLNARVFSTGPTLNAALRLFDALGNQLQISNPQDSRDATIATFVIINGGTYYIAVSEASNVTYNPNDVATGLPGTTTGAYTLTVEVSGGVGDPTQNVTGGQLELGLGGGGLVGTGSGTGYRGVRYNGQEFLPIVTTGGQQVPSHFLGGTAGGIGFVNTNTTGGSIEQPLSTNNESDAFNTRIVTEGVFRGLSIQRTLSYNINDRAIAVDVTLTNTATSALTGVTWMEGFNPNQGVPLDFARGTSNDVSGKVVSARYVNTQFQSGLIMALMAPAADARAKATVVQGTGAPRDSGVLAGQAVVDPNGAVSDSQIAMSFALGDVATTSSVSFRYFIILANSDQDLAGVVATIDANGPGHLATTSTSSATETLSNGATVAQFPYRSYYPEGFLGPNIFTFLPMANPNDKAATVTVIQRFEGVPAAQRDRVVATITIPARSRGGVDVNTPDLFNSTLQFLPQANRPYALEVRSDIPVATTLAYYDLVQITSGPVAVGESFTTSTNTKWTFSDVQTAKTFGAPDAINTFIVLYNPNALVSKTIVRLFNTTTGQVFRVVRDIGAFERSGAYLGAAIYDLEGTTFVEQQSLPDGTYGVLVDSELPIVAAKTTYNPLLREAGGTVGNAGVGATTGVVTGGEFGQRSTTESLGVLNTNATATTVVLEFLTQDGSAYRTSIEVPANSHRSLTVGSLPNFPQNQPYSVAYTANVPVSLGVTSPVLQGGVTDAFSMTSAEQGFSSWGFGEGFRPGDNSRWTVGGIPNQPHPGLAENLRIFNPGTTAVTVEITLNFSTGTEVYRRVVEGRRVARFDITEFIPSNRRAENQAYGIFVKAPSTIVAAIDRYDLLFPGGFSTLGMPMGRTSTI
jgi:subtilisin family serine protease/subtilisin-like proprotein convertase family protein